MRFPVHTKRSAAEPCYLRLLVYSIISFTHRHGLSRGGRTRTTGYVHARMTFAPVLFIGRYGVWTGEDLNTRYVHGRPMNCCSSPGHRVTWISTKIFWAQVSISYSWTLFSYSVQCKPCTPPPHSGDRQFIVTCIFFHRPGHDTYSPWKRSSDQFDKHSLAFCQRNIGRDEQNARTLSFFQNDKVLYR